MQNNNTRPVKMELKGEAGKRVLLAAARRIAKTHHQPPSGGCVLKLRMSLIGHP